MTASLRRDDRILQELTTLAQGPQDHGLIQFRSLAGSAQYRKLYDLVRRHVPQGATVLDWGCGNGHFAYWLVCSGYKAVTFSIQEETLVDWIPHGCLREVQGDSGEPVKLPFPDASFDAVASVGVLEHVIDFGGDELASLREIRRTLRARGVFVCYHFPNRHAASEAVSRRLCPGSFHHAHLYDRRRIAELVRAAGLELVEAFRYGLLPRNCLGRLPKPLRLSPVLASMWDASDDGLSRLFNLLCQNYAFVARRPA